jgi:hypothetical protein
MGSSKLTAWIGINLVGFDLTGMHWNMEEVIFGLTGLDYN